MVHKHKEMIKSKCLYKQKRPSNGSGNNSGNMSIHLRIHRKDPNQIVTSGGINTSTDVNGGIIQATHKIDRQSQIQGTGAGTLFGGYPNHVTENSALNQNNARNTIVNSHSKDDGTVPVVEAPGDGELKICPTGKVAHINGTCLDASDVEADDDLSVFLFPNWVPATFVSRATDTWTVNITGGEQAKEVPHYTVRVV